MEWFKTVCFDIEIFLKNEMKNDSIFGNVKPINAYLTRHIIFMAGCMNALFLLSLVMYGSTREFTVFVNLHVTIQLQPFEVHHRNLETVAQWCPFRERIDLLEVEPIRL